MCPIPDIDIKEQSVLIIVFICLVLAFAIIYGCREREINPYWGKEVPIPEWAEIIRKQPPELVEKARKVLKGRIATVWELDFHKNWLSNRIFCFVDEYDSEAIFLETDDKDYLQLNCPSGIPAINKILVKYSFQQKDFDNPEKVDSFLKLLVGYYAGGRLIVGSSVFLEGYAKNERRDGWLQGREKSEEVFKSLCKDPVFEFEGNNWKVVFNVFKPDGSVDKWVVKGEYVASTKSNKVHTIDISRLKREGTFSYPLFG